MKKEHIQIDNRIAEVARTGWKSFLLPVALIVCMFAVILISELGVVTRTTDSVHKDMQGWLRANAQTVSTKMEDLYESIEAVAPTMSYEAGYTTEQMLMGMNALRSAHGFDFVVRTNTEGIAFNYLGKENIDLSQRAYVHKALTGVRAIEFVSSGAYDTENSYVIMAVPVLYDGQVVGVLHGSYKTENYVSLLSKLSGESDRGCDEISLVAADGTVIASSNQSFDSAALMELSKRVAAEEHQAADDVYSQAYEAEGQTRHYYFSRLEGGTSSGWFIVSRMSPDYLSAQTSYARRSAIALMAVAIAITIALLCIVISRQRLSNEVSRHSAMLTDALDAAKKADVAKSQFLSRMSHEIRTPLNAVIGYNTLARNEMTEAKNDQERRQAGMKVMDCLSKSDIASKHLLTIINDVLDMSSIESGKIKVVKERFDFTGMITSLTAVFYSQAKAKGVELEVRFDEQMEEWVVGDQMRTNQILTNLLSNAVKFTPDGGKVVLSLRPVTMPDTIQVHFEVSDTGIGISPEHMERLWNPFEQADSSISRRFGGTGLGLSITKTLVDLLGGTINVVSQPGEGSTFRFALPFERTEQPQNTGLYDFSTINALIVDDDVSTCDYIRLLLTRSGVHSTAVTSGPEALTAVVAALEKGEPYTVCLVDWRMPKMDGLETIRRIRDIAGSELPVIVITAYDFSEVADEATELGINMFISKPLFQSSLFNLLANISGGAGPKESERLSVCNFSGAHVLLVEDNAMNMDIARKILESAGLSVDSAWNGQEAVAMFEAAPAGVYSAILMDVQMPVMDGYQATRTIRSLARPDAMQVPIIAMTADAFAENIAESFASGMDGHISKPIDIPALFETLEKYIICPNH